MPYQVMVVDDQNMSRKLFEMMVKSSPRYEVAFSLDSATLAPIYASRYPVDLVILDVVMKEGMNGLEAAERIKSVSPSTKILIVTSMPEFSYLERARQIGCESFWYKEASDQELLDVMDRTMAGESIYPVSSPAVRLGQAMSTELTRSELAVLKEMSTGASNQQIAERLFISVTTVKTHISNLLQKTGFSNRTELAIEARVQGLVISEGK